mmetsp:Transcript_13529/g.29211  ORF Transcript_13529/g.29211 Transcript_13529/m.29211 type:complete len:83 (-) Transcript_13529:20-268(-)
MEAATEWETLSATKVAESEASTMMPLPSALPETMAQKLLRPIGLSPAMTVGWHLSPCNLEQVQQNTFCSYHALKIAAGQISL